MSGELPVVKARPEVTRTGSRCPACHLPLAIPGGPLRARHLAVVDGKVVSFCSLACRDRGPVSRAELVSGANSVIDEGAGSRALRHPFRWLLAITPLVVLGGVLLGARISIHWRTANALPVASAPVAPPVALPPEPEFGPEAPPPEALADSDRWVHPLPGPVRRLPERPSRRFGAGRDHDSPDSCGGGHCGCDIGELKGETVMAAHDGVVERVVRVEGDDRGGKYVRLLHYGGRVVTQYMHLDTVNPDLAPGMHVRAGDPLGTVGDSGTHNSGPHLHFTFATRSTDNAPEVYVDPLALLTLWPLIQR